MSKFCEEARHLIIQLFVHFEENKSQFLTANHAANLAFTDNCHFLSKSHVLVPWVPEDIFFLIDTDSSRRSRANENIKPEARFIS